eukprot:m.22949 g.22949  ORF g.22949 m.22949 type:complete len:237 (+) comp12846_c0_seq4:229-939(+)
MAPLTWRQQDSFDKASELYPKAKNVLSPDVAFMIGPIRNTLEYTKRDAKRVDILFALRSDKESVLGGHQAARTKLGELLNSTFLTWNLVDWDSRTTFYNGNVSRPPMQQVRVVAIPRCNKLVTVRTNSRRDPIQLAPKIVVTLMLKQAGRWAHFWSNSFPFVFMKCLNMISISTNAVMVCLIVSKTRSTKYPERYATIEEIALQHPRLRTSAQQLSNTSPAGTRRNEAVRAFGMLL